MDPASFEAQICSHINSENLESQFVLNVIVTCERLTGLFYSVLSGKFTYTLTDETSAKLDLMNNGPFVALLITCLDFMLYKSGEFFQISGYFT